MLKGFRIVNSRLLHPRLGSTGALIALNDSAVAASDRSCCGALVLLSCLWVSVAALPTQSQTTAPTSSPDTPAAAPATNATIPSERPILKLGSQGDAVTELQAMLKLLGFYTEAVDGVYQDSTATAVSAFQQAAGIQPDGVVGAETWNRLLPAAPPITSTTATVPTAPAPRNPSPTSPVGSNSSPTIPTSNTPTPTPTLTPTPATTAVNPATPAPSSGYTPVTPTPSPTPAPGTATGTATSSVEFPILRVGMQGEAVTRLQERLKAIGVFSGAIDGFFGPETETAVQAAQRNYNLEPDGIVGPATWKALLQGS